MSAKSVFPLFQTNFESSSKITASSLLGTASLAIALPLFNSMGSESDADTTRATVNTVFAAGAAATAAAAISTAMAGVVKGDEPRAQNPSNIINSSILGALVGGGVAAGTIGTLMIQPFGAAAVGWVAGIAGTVFFTMLELKHPALMGKPGVLSFHGLPALMSGLVGVVMAAISEDASAGGGLIYHMSLYPIYPARIPRSDDTGSSCAEAESCGASLGEIISNFPFLEGLARGRSAAVQAAYQAATLVATAMLAAFGGAATGAIVRVSAAKCGNSYPLAACLDEDPEELAFGREAVPKRSRGSQRWRRNTTPAQTTEQETLF